MFESAEVGSEVDKATYDKEAAVIRAKLLEAQRQLASAGFSVVILVGGVEGAGKSEAVNTLHAWMDSRGIRTTAFSTPTAHEADYPEFARYWHALPAKGHIGIIFGSWYSDPIVQRAFGKEDDARFDQRLERILEFERMLTSEDVVVVKLWMHLGKKEQKKRLNKLAADPLQSWRVTRQDWKYFKRYDEFRKTSEHALRRTSSAEAPWHIIEATDERYRTLAVTRTLLTTLEERLAIKEPKAKLQPSKSKPPADNLLRQLDLTKALDGKPAKKKLLKAQAHVGSMARELAKEGRSMVLVFEGQDAAGKGGAIRRVTEALDARYYQVNAVAAPTEEERARPYLWRFWRNVPRLGHVAIFDRSWYGRVLVERVEGFAAPEDWKRGYSEINAFEDQLIESGAIVRKFWLQISQEEQLQRFKSRERTPYKQYKITEEDWRNRNKWDAYEAAACEMFEKTSTEAAPWILVEGNDKEWARAKVAKSVAAALEAELEDV